MKRIAVIGAGMSGLTLSRALQHHAQITIFEKSRGVGGRMSTRRADPYAFDHGAQFFTARSEAFNAWIAPMLAAGVVQRWDARVAEFERTIKLREYQWDASDAHYVGAPAMNAVAKYMSQGLDIRLGVRVQTLQKQSGMWQLSDDQGNALGSFDWVIVAIPAEQAAELLPSTLSCYPEVQATRMQGCFSLMLGFEHALPLDFDVARIKDSDIQWIAVNSSKPARNPYWCLTVNSSNSWADAHMEDDRNQVQDYLSQLTSEIIGHGLSGAAHKALHGWRYATISTQQESSFLMDAQEKIGVCGDWLRDGKVEAAFTSGSELAQQILHTL